MKKNIFILFLGLITSCNSNKKLEGTWIGAYSYSEKFESFMNLPIRNFVTFKDNEYFAKNFTYDYLSEKSFGNGTYEYRSNEIILDSDIENNKIIESINNDSLVFKGKDGSNNSVFKKLNDSLKNKSKNIKLIGKRFFIKSKEYNDTLSFINDTLIIKSSDKTKNPGTRWERFNHNGFDILFMEMDIPLIIREELNDKIHLTGFHKKRYDIELIELK
ncbi:hypothetical protein [Thalassobellus citreus]|uniref:hypothetical protein n=1 Tax=Thalassobellus citreus TaxID=3367752 RepID=UPI003788D1AA